MNIHLNKKYLLDKQVTLWSNKDEVRNSYIDIIEHIKKETFYLNGLHSHLKYVIRMNNDYFNDKIREEESILVKLKKEHQKYKRVFESISSRLKEGRVKRSILEKEIDNKYNIRNKLKAETNGLKKQINSLINKRCLINMLELQLAKLNQTAKDKELLKKLLIIKIKDMNNKLSKLNKTLYKSPGLNLDQMLLKDVVLSPKRQQEEFKEKKTKNLIRIENKIQEELGIKFIHKMKGHLCMNRILTVPTIIIKKIIRGIKVFNCKIILGYILIELIVSNGLYYYYYAHMNYKCFEKISWIFNHTCTYYHLTIIENILLLRFVSPFFYLAYIILPKLLNIDIFNDM
ncbi:hypothetical protein K502DRAFT_340194 [Neoconidiobolus thromboides FSU 785]|nr:hypothetical protein K502DRAFT_340194 [Neoconidiobolus thromboides FSU 785]